VPGAVHQQGAHVIHHARQQYQTQEAPIPPAVEDVAGDQQETVLPAVVEQEVDRQDNSKENAEIYGRKVHENDKIKRLA